MQEYRNTRMAQIQESYQKPRFGSVIEINKQQWEEHITRAPKDVPVVIHLYQS